MTVDKTALLEEIEKLPAKSQSSYTKESWNNYATALKEAQRVYADENATQAEVDAAVKALQDAKNGTCRKE